MDNVIGHEYLVHNRIRVSSNKFYFKETEIGLPFNLGDIINTNKNFIPNELGIYHLFSDDVLVYIGMSTNLKNRLNLCLHY